MPGPSATVSTGSSWRLSGVRPMNWLTITSSPVISSAICTTECMITLIARVAVAGPGVAQRDVVLGHVAEQRDDHERRERRRDADRLRRRLEARDEPLRRQRRHRAARRPGTTMPSRNGQLGVGLRRASPPGMCGARSSMRMKKTPDDGERDAGRQRDALAVAREQVARDGQDRHRHERDDAERRDAGEQAAIEAQRRAPAAADRAAAGRRCRRAGRRCRAASRRSRS